MAGKLIRRKELYEWVDGFQTDIQRKFDEVRKKIKQGT